MTTMYDAIGGRDAVASVVDGFYDRLMSDTAVRHHFSPERLPSLKLAQVGWFSAVLQGEEPPSDLQEVHAHLVITDAEVDAVLAHLDAVLAELVVDRRLRRGVVSLISRLWHARQF